MKKFAVLFLLLAFLLSSVESAKAQQTRPRRVGQTPPVSAPQQPATTTTTAPQQPAPGRRPPVLGGANNTGTPQSGTQTTTTTSPADDEQVEIGEGDVLRVNTTLVTVPVSVLDRDGKYVPNLRQADFRIYEDGVEQEVAYFASAEKPFTVALIIDTSGSTQSKLGGIQEAAIAFVNQLRAADRVMVVSFDDRVRLLAEPTSDRYTLHDAIRRAEPGEGTKLYDAVDYVINERFNRIQGRKAIVLFTDGVDTTSRRATYESNIRDAEELDALIYPIQYDTYSDITGGGSSSGPVVLRIPGWGNIIIPGRGRVLRGRGTSRAEYDTGAQYLRDLAQKTGTRVQEATDDPRFLTQAFSIIAEELRRQYSLGYYPKGQGQAGQRRQIRVQVKRPNLAVRARDSYIFKGEPGQTPQDQQQTAPQLRNRQTATQP